MPYFKLRKDAKRWFRYIENGLKIDFDMYYFCLMAGLALRKREDVPDSTDLTDYFPGEYKEKGRLIVALFLSRELTRMGVALTERARLHSEIRERIAPSDSSHLSDVGMRELNRYASAGFEALAEHFGDEPRDLETFLPMYQRFIDATAAEPRC